MHSRSDLAVETVGLTKRFGSVRAVDGVDLAVPTGSVYAVLGPNGAGKTTIIRVLATLLVPDGGTARVLGHDVRQDPAAVRRRVVLTGQFASVDEDLTGRDNLLLQGRLLGYSRRQTRAKTSELLDGFGLAEAANRTVKTYSGGMRRRLDIAASIMVTPELIFLDEPTTGLDPRSRNQVWETIRSAVTAGSTVLLTTQYLDEADQLADRVAVVDHGTVIAEGTTGELKASVGSGALRVRLRDPGQRERAERVLTEALDEPVHLDSDPASLTVGVTDGGRVPAALARLTADAIEVTEFALGQPSLDEVFLAITGHFTATDHEDSKEVAA